MRHTKTPTQDGWYWIADHPGQDEDWRLCYLWTEEQVTRMAMYDPDALRSTEWRGATDWILLDGETRWRDADVPGGSWSGPEVWYGPLAHPGGDFGDCIVEAGESTHAEAEKYGKAIVIKHVDYTHCNHAGGTVTCVKLMNQDEALAKERTA